MYLSAIETSFRPKEKRFTIWLVSQRMGILGYNRQQKETSPLLHYTYISGGDRGPQPQQPPRGALSSRQKILKKNLNSDSKC